MASKRRTVRIQDVPKTKRPRERLATLGSANLTNEELLAVILGSGTSQDNVLTLSRKTLRTFPLENLQTATLADLRRVKGIGIVGASKIIASLELGRRAVGESPAKKVQTPADVLREVDGLREKSQEYVVALYLNARRELVKKQVIAIGSMNQNIIEARDIFSPALALPCGFFILVHNHPSGDPQPSDDDLALTKKLLKAGSLLGISLIDHLVVTRNEYFSFRESGLV